MNYIEEIREYDVPLITRVCIDTDVRVGRWHLITPVVCV